MGRLLILSCWLLPSLLQGQELAPGKDLYGDPLPPGAVARLGTIRMRPGVTVKFLAYSRDGKKLASCGEEPFKNFLSFWDADTGRELRRQDLRDGQIQAWAWLKDARSLTIGRSIFANTSYHIWDTADNQPTWEKEDSKRPYGEFTCFAIDPNGKLIGAGGKRFNDKPRPIQVWRAQAGKRLEDLDTPRSLGNQPCDTEWLCFAPESKALVALNRLGKEFELAVWDVEKLEQRLKAKVPFPYRQPMSLFGGTVTLSADGKSLGLGMAGGIVRIFDLQNGKETRTVRVAEEDAKSKRPVGVSALAFAASGKYMVAGLDNGQIVRWNLADNKEAWRIDAHRFGVLVLAMSPDGRRLATSSYAQEGIIRQWDADNGQEINRQMVPATWEWSLDVSPDGHFAITTSRERRLRIWDVKKGRLSEEVETATVVPQPRFLHGSNAVLACVEQRLQVLDRNKQTWSDLEGPLGTQPCDDYSWSSDRKHLATWKDNEVTLWSWPAGRMLTRLEPPAGSDPKNPVKVTGVAISAEGAQLLTTVEDRANLRGGRSARVELWNWKKDRTPVSISEEVNSLIKTAFAPDESGLLLAGDGARQPPFVSRESSLRLVSTSGGKILRSFPATPNFRNQNMRFVRDFALSPDGRTIASAENDHSVVIFELATGLVRRQLVGHRNEVITLAFTPDGRRLVTMAFDNTGLVWDLSLAAAVKAKPRESDIAQAWSDLTNTQDGTKVHQAMATLAASPAEGVALIRDKIPPAPPQDPKHLQRLVSDLDSPTFTVRDKAYAELDRLGEDAFLFLRGQLEKKLPLEVSVRLQRLVDKHDPVNIEPNRLREIRAIEILEHLATPDARQVLQELAKGAPTSRFTQDAVAALERLDRIAKSLP